MAVSGMTASEARAASVVRVDGAERVELRVRAKEVRRFVDSLDDAGFVLGKAELGDLNAAWHGALPADRTVTLTFVPVGAAQQ